MSILKIENVCKSFGNLKVLKNNSLEVEKGEVVCIIGPSGAGKSTLLRTINQLETISSGKIWVNDTLLVDRKHGINRNNISHKEIAKHMLEVGMVFQRFNLFPHMTVLENVMSPQQIVKKVPKDKAKEKASELLAKVGLSDKEDAYPNKLSGGQQQRVAIARALAMDPQIMLFDEPTSALDPEMVGEVLTLIKTLVDKKNTIIIVSHEMEFIKNCATKVLFLDEGKIAYSGTPQKVFSTKDCPRLTEFLSKTSYK